MPRSADPQADLFAALLRQAKASGTPASLLRTLELLLALLASLLGPAEQRARMPWRHPPAPARHAAREPYPIHDRSKPANRLRAWIGWVLRGLPDLGMTPSGARPTPPCPTRAARAPPHPRPAHLRPVPIGRQNPASGGAQPRPSARSP